jgi:hypothetical protein
MQITATWPFVLLVAETGYASLLQIADKWQLFFFRDETGVRQSSANNRQVAVSFICR